MARQNEIECLQRVKESFFDGGPIKIVFDNSDKKEMSFILKSAIPNSRSNDFPDFVFPDGGIEHFQVTSSEEIEGKGSAFKHQEAEFNRETKKFVEEQAASLKKDQYAVVTSENTYVFFRMKIF